MKNLRDDESETALAIEPIVGLVVVRVQPAAIVIAVNVEQFRIAVGKARNTAKTTASQNTPSSCILFGIHNALISRAKYLYFLESPVPRCPKP